MSRICLPFLLSKPRTIYSSEYNSFPARLDNRTCRKQPELLFPGGGGRRRERAAILREYKGKEHRAGASYCPGDCLIENRRAMTGNT